jgi:hypothetical protein
MNKQTMVLGFAGAMLASGAWAQQQQNSVAKLTQVNGNVLVSRQAGMTTGTESQQIVNGSRVITTANGHVVVVFDSGCRVELKENQRLDVDNDKPCAALIPVSLAVAVPAVGAPLAGLFFPGLIVGTALVGNGGGSPNPPTPVSPN